MGEFRSIAEGGRALPDAARMPLQLPVDKRIDW
jgi:hypothetical protein